MTEYHKIKSIYKRDEKTGKFLENEEWSIPEFNYLKDNLWTFTEKVDGTNIRIMWDEGQVKIGGRTDKAQIPVFLYDILLSLFTVKEMENTFTDGTPVCLYGEGYGARIQKGGKYISDGVNFILFDVKIGPWWLKRRDIETIASDLCIEVVPIVGTGTLYQAIRTIKDGLSSTWGDFLAEGMVLRPLLELKDRAGRRIITKLKHKDFN